jgi:hypothetical protein
MDASVSSSKSRQTKASHQAVAALDDAAIKTPKALAPQVLSSLPADEAPIKPVFVKREKRETRAFESTGSTEPSKRGHEVASGSHHAKKPLCSFEDE